MERYQTVLILVVNWPNGENFSRLIELTGLLIIGNERRGSDFELEREIFFLSLNGVIILKSFHHKIFVNGNLGRHPKYLDM